jgi:hypothetical protein
MMRVKYHEHLDGSKKKPNCIGLSIAFLSEDIRHFGPVDFNDTYLSIRLIDYVLIGHRHSPHSFLKGIKFTAVKPLLIEGTE